MARPTPAEAPVTTTTSGIREFISLFLLKKVFISFYKNATLLYARHTFVRCARWRHIVTYRRLRDRNRIGVAREQVRTV
jgi:hypothetical protein